MIGTRSIFMSIQAFNLTIHIIGGFTALVFGGAAIYFSKGGKLHKTSGRIYYFSILTVSITSIITLFINQYSDARLFLTFIGLFTLYLAFSGVRIQLVKSLKARQHSKSRLDYVCGIAMAGSGVVMGFLAIRYVYLGYHAQNDLSNSFYLFAGLYALFAWFSIGMGLEDFFKYRSIESLNSRSIIPTHISRMLGAYTATVTAFLVVNSTKIFPAQYNIFVWILPGAIGGFLINWFIRRLKIG